MDPLNITSFVQLIQRHIAKILVFRLGIVLVGLFLRLHSHFGVVKFGAKCLAMAQGS